jgi:hypothetical protein
MDITGRNRRFTVGASAIALVLLLWLSRPAARMASAPARASPAAHRTYSTNFAHEENPISEGGNWISAKAASIDWADVRTIPGFAFGTEAALITTAPGKYDDSTALLAGTWGPNQGAEATVRCAKPDDNVWEEVELRLRSTLSPHQATGYEILFRCAQTSKGYHDIVKWNGPLGIFSCLKHLEGLPYGVKTGDTIKATIVGNIITTYINGVRTFQVTDNTFKSGNPGIGFYLAGATGAVDADYGLTSFKAWEE